MKTSNATTLPISNLTNAALAQYLHDQRKGATFSAVIYTKVGITRKGVRYGDDTVLDTIVTGFTYENLCQRDLSMLESGDVSAKQLQEKIASLGLTDRDGNVPSEAECEQAIQEQIASFRRSLDGTNVSTTDHVREPVIVNGRVIKGCWINNGCVDERKKGISYLYGLRVGRTILEPADNGPAPSPASRAVPLAKRILKSKFLRIGRFVSIRLDSSSLISLKLGGEAAVLADEKGVTIKDGMTIREIYEAA